MENILASEAIVSGLGRLLVVSVCQIDVESRWKGISVLVSGRGLTQ